MSNAAHPIRVVSRLTGLSTHVIRIWEQRYEAVRPVRTVTNRRLYSDEQVERLKLLGVVARSGHNIGLIAQWPTEKLRQQAAQTLSAIPLFKPTLPEIPDSLNSIAVECLAAMKSFDSKAFETALKRGAMLLGAMGLLQQVIAPLSQRIGEMWVEGSITVAHEHLATAVLRSFLLNSAKPFGATAQCPRLVVTTPAGQIHELGALLVAAAASHLDWQVVYLGANLPAPEIAGAARHAQARAVALSLVYPGDNPRLHDEFKLLRELLPGNVAILAGGRAMPAYRDTLRQIAAVPVEDISDLASKLEELRKPAPNISHSKSPAH